MIIVVKTVAGMVKIDIYCDGNMEVRETINCLESRSIHLLYQKVLKLFMEVTDEQQRSSAKIACTSKGLYKNNINYIWVPAEDVYKRQEVRDYEYEETW